ncbi:MAG: tetratricopeptide repeat protein [Patescibacteria group bacterium]
MIGAIVVIGILPMGRSDVGPDILTPLAGGDREAMRRMDDRASLAVQEGNRVAQAIVQDAKIAQGPDACSNRYMTVCISTHPGALLYEDTEKDWLIAVEKKATAGDPFFMEVMGHLWFRGSAGLSVDKQKGLAWWKKASDLNCGVAKLRLGFCYSEGNGVPRDLEKAAVYYREAGELGVSWGWYCLGCFYDGWGGWPRDLAKAMECWAKAAPMGHALAQYNLGWTYAEGTGVPQNIELARKWMEAAAARGLEDAKTYLKTHPNLMTSGSHTNGAGASHPSDKTIIPGKAGRFHEW